ncbi:MAG: hypothetical protein IT303_17160 [Dehalococcoidia bacterium]|nr:hypothetical protein [Dehalococcoidia bacterium]
MLASAADIPEREEVPLHARPFLHVLPLLVIAAQVFWGIATVYLAAVLGRHRGDEGEPPSNAPA